MIPFAVQAKAVFDLIGFHLIDRFEVPAVKIAQLLTGDHAVKLAFTLMSTTVTPFVVEPIGTDVLRFPNTGDREKRVIISQPGLRYAQEDAPVRSLLLDKRFHKLSVPERNRVSDRALGAIRGRMIEGLAPLETKIAKPRKQVFQLPFAMGAFEMVIHDPETLTCEIYESKLSREVVPAPYQHLIHTEKCAETEHRFGQFTGKYMIHQGEPAESEGIRYLNVEDDPKSFA